MAAITTADASTTAAGARPAAARTTDAVKEYGKGDAMVRALDGITIAFDKEQFSAIMGPSGSGKSTLLHCLAGLDRLTSGTVHIGDVELGSLSDRQLTMLRRVRVGFIFQSFNLVPTLSALRQHRAAAHHRGTQAGSRGARRGGAHHRPRGPPQAPAQPALREDSNSASPQRARSPASPRSSSPTSPPATSTRAPAPTCSTSSATP
jgi:ABC-type glutathione transport system ATPase component